MVKVTKVYGKEGFPRIETRVQTHWEGTSEGGMIHLHSNELGDVDSPNHIYKGEAYPGGYLVLEAI